MSQAAEIDFPDVSVLANLDVAWIHGSQAAKYNTDPDIQVHAYDEHTYILRQNMAVHYEAPFMFLLFGRSAALLLDTGATADPQFFPWRRTVDAIIDDWLARHPRPGDYGLLILHTHSHTDHTAADGQFAGRPGTLMIGAKRDAAWPYFGFTDEPDLVAQVDLGGRVLDLAWQLPGTTRRRLPTTTAIAGSSSRATPSTQAGCTSSTGRPSSGRSAGGGMVRATAGYPPARLPHRDDDQARRGLSGRVELPARRTSPRASHRSPRADPGHAKGARFPARPLRPATNDHHPCRLTADPALGAVRAAWRHP